MDQPALFLVEADEKLHSKLDLISEQPTFKYLSAFIVGYLFAERQRKNMDDFEHILRATSLLLETKSKEKLTFSQYILSLEKLVFRYS